MANFRERYLKELKIAKKEAADVKLRLERRDPATDEERRIFETFSKHAELDFQTLKKSKPKRGP